jgi:uncharacterized membrane protein
MEVDVATKTKAQLEERLRELEALVEAPKHEAPTNTVAPTNTDKVKTAITVALGVGIPLLSLAMSKIGGTLLFTHVPLALSAFGIMIAVLVVSLPHLRWSICDITKSSPLASWCLAVALDLSLVCCELVHVYATESGLDVLVVTVMGTVAVASMVLNCWAFLKNPHKPSN